MGRFLTHHCGAKNRQHDNQFVTLFANLPFCNLPIGLTFRRLRLPTVVDDVVRK